MKNEPYTASDAERREASATKEYLEARDKSANSGGTLDAYYVKGYLDLPTGPVEYDTYVSANSGLAAVMAVVASGDNIEGHPLHAYPFTNVTGTATIYDNQRDYDTAIGEELEKALTLD